MEFVYFMDITSDGEPDGKMKSEQFQGRMEYTIWQKHTWKDEIRTFVREGWSALSVREPDGGMKLEPLSQ